MCTKLAYLIVITVITQLIKDAEGCSGSSVSEICKSDIPDIPEMSSRDPSKMITNESFYAIDCDLYTIYKYTWYKSEFKMTNSCPRMFMCSTQFPIWMEGSHPEPNEGIVNRTGCLKSYEKCCVIRYSLAAVNCGDHMAYCLYGLPHGCHQRYCFDAKRADQKVLSKQYNRQYVQKISSTPTFSQSKSTRVHRQRTTTQMPSELPSFADVSDGENIDRLNKQSKKGILPDKQQGHDDRRLTESAFSKTFRRSGLPKVTSNAAFRTRGMNSRNSQQGTTTMDHFQSFHDEVKDSKEGSKKGQLTLSDVGHDEARIISQRQKVSRDGKLLTLIMIACIGVMVVTIVALLLVLVKRKQKINDQTTEPTTMAGQKKKLKALTI